MPRILLLLSLILAAVYTFPASAQQCSYEGQEFCQSGETYTCTKTGDQLTRIYQNRKCVVNVPSLTGVWKGMGHQSPAGATSSDYMVVMTITDNGGSIDYPSLSCGGSLTKVSESGTSAQFGEHITYGKCIDNGSITVNLFNGRLAWTWIGQGSSGQQFNVIAVLER